jgi:hypothetical protein
MSSGSTKSGVKKQMQNALRKLQMSLFEVPDPASAALNILSLKPAYSTPPPSSHEHIRARVGEVLDHSSVQPHPDTLIAALIQSNIATILPTRRLTPSAIRSFWHVADRLSARALSEFTLRLSCPSDGLDVVAIGGEELYFYTRLPEHLGDAQERGSVLLDAMFSFTNEILETMDAFGRFYMLPIPAQVADASGASSQHVVAYLTEGEVDALAVSGTVVELF